MCRRLSFAQTNPNMKRYWSTIHPLLKERMTKEQIIESDKFDANLSPDDVVEMQKIDADCNDCRHFKRGAMTKVGGLTRFDGHCLNLNVPTEAWPMQYTDRACFEHRRA